MDIVVDTTSVPLLVVAIVVLSSIEKERVSSCMFCTVKREKQRRG